MDAMIPKTTSWMRTARPASEVNIPPPPPKRKPMPKVCPNKVIVPPKAKIPPPEMRPPTKVQVTTTPRSNKVTQKIRPSLPHQKGKRKLKPWDLARKNAEIPKMPTLWMRKPKQQRENFSPRVNIPPPPSKREPIPEDCPNKTTRPRKSFFPPRMSPYNPPSTKTPTTSVPHEDPCMIRKKTRPNLPG